MSLDLADYKTKARSAVKTFWTSRKISGTKKRLSGNKNQGKHNTETSDGSMDGFIDLIEDIVHANGLTEADILWKGFTPLLPSSFPLALPPNPANIPR